MTLSAKWTAASFFALTALGAASFAFAGCTVTSGKIDDIEGGAGNPDTGPKTDSGTDGPVANACPSNTKQTTVFINKACQSALESACCAELKACFDIVPATGADAGGTDDCNKYSLCIPKCRFKADGTTPEPDQKLIGACQDDCDALSQPSIVTAYEAIAKCTTNSPATNTACQ